MSFTEFIKNISFMGWCYTISFLLFSFAVIWALFRYLHYKKDYFFTPTVILVVFTFLSILSLFTGASHDPASPLKHDIFIALYKSIKFFSAGYDVVDFLHNTYCTASLVSCSFFPLYVEFISLFSPILTLTVVLSFFKDVFAHFKLLKNSVFDKHIFVFSELNEKSIALAESIYRDPDHCGKSKVKLVFTDVPGGKSELLERAKAIRAICFKKSMPSVNFKFPEIFTYDNRLCFFAISDNAANNVKIAADIREIYGNRQHTRLYIFNSSIEGELFVSTLAGEVIEIRCIDEAHSLVYRTLYDMERDRIEDGTPDLFLAAMPAGSAVRISAVIVGMDSYGTEMTKALCWFCQMTGYEIKINAFGTQGNTAELFAAMCPEIVDDRHNRVSVPGDAVYDVTVHSGTDTKSADFERQLLEISDATYVLVALGSDELNIATAARIRMLYSRIGISPIIHAVVHNTGKTEMFEGAKNFKAQPYNIDYIGDIETLYSKNVILNSELEKEAFSIHLKYGLPENFSSLSDDERHRIFFALKREFYSYEYNYRSSMASALHLKARIACGLYDSGTAEDIRSLSMLEHRRWNAYMRTEGYVFSGKMEKSTRNDMAKMHHLLVPFDELTDAEKDKDRRISVDTSLIPKIPEVKVRLRDFVRMKYLKNYDKKNKP